MGVRLWSTSHPSLIQGTMGSWIPNSRNSPVACLCAYEFPRAPLQEARARTALGSNLRKQSRCWSGLAKARPARYAVASPGSSSVVEVRK